MERLLRGHDVQKAEVYCYSDTSQSDDIAVRLQGSAQHGRDTYGQVGEAVFELIRADKIDAPARLVREKRERGADPVVSKLLDEIGLRAEVELAKLSRRLA